MDILISKTHEFMKIGGQLAPDKCGKNTDQELRSRLLVEEVEEYLEALKKEDFIEELDGLVDILVIAVGSLLSRLNGERWIVQACIDEVLASNLSKFEEDPITGIRKPVLREDGKIMKGSNYFPPNLKRVLEEWDWEV